MIDREEFYRKQARISNLKNLVAFLFWNFLFNAGLLPYLWQHFNFPLVAIMGWIASGLADVLYTINFVAVWRSWEPPLNTK